MRVLLQQAGQVAHQSVQELTKPNANQKGILIAMGVYVAVIAILWKLPYVHHVLAPLKLLVVALHEFSHAFTGCVTGAKIHAIEVNYNEGGKTELAGGCQCCILPAGYIGSSIFGGLLIFCSLNELAAKIMLAILAVVLLVTLLKAKNNLLRIVCAIFIIIIPIFWVFVGFLLQYIAALLGIMSAMYSIYDIVDDTVFHKLN